MKLKVTQKELNECITNAVRRVLSESKFDKRHGFEKATKSANRDIERDVFGDGFKSYDKPHKTKKDYSRKGKNKFNGRFYDENIDESRVDLSSPFDDNYYDDGYEVDAPDINSIVGGHEYDESGQTDEPTVEIRTDINDSERELLKQILNEFEDIDFDIIDGVITLLVPKSMKKSVIIYLKDNDVEIIKNKKE